MLEKEKSNYIKLINNLIYSENYDKDYKEFISDPYIDNGIYNMDLIIYTGIENIRKIIFKALYTYVKLWKIHNCINIKKLIIYISFGSNSSVYVCFCFLAEEGYEFHAYDYDFAIRRDYLLLEIEDIFLINLLFVMTHKITKKNSIFTSAKSDNFYSIFKIINEHVLKNSKV